MRPAMPRCLAQSCLRCRDGNAATRSYSRACWGARLPMRSASTGYRHRTDRCRPGRDGEGIAQDISARTTDRLRTARVHAGHACHRARAECREVLDATIYARYGRLNGRSAIAITASGHIADTSFIASWRPHDQKRAGLAIWIGATRRPLAARSASKNPADRFAPRIGHVPWGLQTERAAMPSHR